MTYLLELTTPQQLKAGAFAVKTGGTETPIYHDCADCDAKEPVIKGFASTTPHFKWENIGVIPAGGLFKLAVFCAPCFDKRMANATLSTP